MAKYRDTVSFNWPGLPLAILHTVFWKMGLIVWSPWWALLLLCLITFSRKRELIQENADGS